MLESLEGLGNVVGHGEVDSSVFVVPIEVEAAECGARPVFSDVVFL